MSKFLYSILSFFGYDYSARLRCHCLYLGQSSACPCLHYCLAIGTIPLPFCGRDPFGLFSLAIAENEMGTFHICEMRYIRDLFCCNYTTPAFLSASTISAFRLPASPNPPPPGKSKIKLSPFGTRWMPLSGRGLPLPNFATPSEPGLPPSRPWAACLMRSKVAAEIVKGAGSRLRISIL